MTDNKAKPPAQGEPSMEEILASIRRIISEDGDPAKPAAPSTPAAAPTPTPVTPAPVAAAASAPADVLVLTEVAEEEPEPPVTAPPVVPPAPAAPTTAPEPPKPTLPAAESDILSANVAAAATGALSSLVSAKRQTERPMSENPMPLGNPGATLESIVRDEIRPLLKAWLDQNLPAMVERIVQREIQRISRNLE